MAVKLYKNGCRVRNLAGEAKLYTDASRHAGGRWTIWLLYYPRARFTIPPLDGVWKRCHGPTSMLGSIASVHWVNSAWSPDTGTQKDSDRRDSLLDGPSMPRRFMIWVTLWWCGWGKGKVGKPLINSSITCWVTIKNRKLPRSGIVPTHRYIPPPARFGASSYNFAPSTRFLTR